MFSFFKKKKKVKPVRSEEELQEARKIREEKDAQELANLLEGEESYKIFSWRFTFHNGKMIDNYFLSLKKWEPIEEVFTILEKEYENIREGGLILKIKDSVPSCDGDEVASLEIHIKHGYMRPYMRYREEGAIYAEEEKEYMGKTLFDENDNRIGALEFEHDDFIPTAYLTKDINLVKKIFKEFYETGDVSEEYME